MPAKLLLCNSEFIYSLSDKIGDGDWNDADCNMNNNGLWKQSVLYSEEMWSSRKLIKLVEQKVSYLIYLWMYTVKTRELQIISNNEAF